MVYSTPNDVRLRAVGMTTEVIPDVSSSGLNLTTCIAEADAEIEEAGRAGDYEVPFSPTPTRIQDLSAVGALARARRALELGNQPAAQTDPYRQEFEAGLELLRRGAMDLGTVVVSGAALVMPVDDGWTQLSHRGVIEGSVALKNQSATFTYVEDRREYEPDYKSDAIKDYQVDHREGKVRRLSGGRIGAGESVLVGYEYYYRQPGRAQDAEYEGRTASVGQVRRGDEQG